MKIYRIKKYKTALFSVLVVIFVLALSFCTLQAVRYDEDFTIESPDNLHRLVVYRDSWHFGFPGSSGDAAGFIKLIDVRTDKCIKKRRFEMIQLIDLIEWESDYVYIRHVGTMFFDGKFEIGY